MRFIPRRQLPHESPAWVRAGALYFLTIHCASRGAEQLTIPARASRLLESVRFYHEAQRWYVRIFLLMPDHAHALIAFPETECMQATVSHWKRYTSRETRVVWQRDFFDHRIRGGENWQLKAEYIRANPVRKGLVPHAEDWPWKFET